MHRWLRRAAIAAAMISCGFTGYFGWTTGGDDTFAKVFNAAAGGLISLAVPVFFMLCGMAEHRGKAVAMYLFGAFGALFGALDAGSNIGALFSMREASIIRANHTTTVSGDARQRVQRLRQEHAKLSAVVSTPGAWISVSDAEKALERTLAAKDREADRVKCGPKCEALDAQARDLRMEIAKARSREDAIAKLSAVQTQLAEAEEMARETPPVVSPVEVIKSKLGSLFGGFDLKPGEDIREITYLVITFLFGAGLTVLSGALGYGATWLTGGAHMPAEPMQQPAPAPRHYIAAPAGHEATPLYPVKTAESSVTVNYQGNRPPSVDRLVQMIAELDAKRA